jgi:hypothetical protein
VSLSFRVFQYELGGAKDDELLKFLGYFFNCGNLNYHEDKKAVIFIIRKFEDINIRLKVLNTKILKTDLKQQK